MAGEQARADWVESVRTGAAPAEPSLEAEKAADLDRAAALVPARDRVVQERAAGRTPLTVQGPVKVAPADREQGATATCFFNNWR
jgi:hypothetical protein